MPIFLVCGREPFTTSVYVELLGGERPAGSQFLSYVARFELRSEEAPPKQKGGRKDGREGERVLNPLALPTSHHMNAELWLCYC